MTHFQKPPSDQKEANIAVAKYLDAVASNIFLENGIAVHFGSYSDAQKKRIQRAIDSVRKKIMSLTPVHIRLEGMSEEEKAKVIARSDKMRMVAERHLVKNP